VVDLPFSGLNVILQVKLLKLRGTVRELKFPVVKGSNEDLK
jgi:hypothetical protein